MLGSELRWGDEYRVDDVLIYKLESNPSEASDTTVLVRVHYTADGGIEWREFNKDDEVPHTRPVPVE